MVRTAAAFLVMALVIGAAGCASEGVRKDANTEVVTTHDFNPKDLQLISRQTVAQLIAKVQTPAGRTSSAYVAAVRNLTSEHVNGEAIRQYIEVELDDSERFVLVDRSAAREQALKELEVQQGALVDPATAVRVGKHIGAQYLFFGTLTSIETQSGRKKGQYFLFTLKFLDVETGRFRTTRKEIQKLSKRGLFGW